MHQRCYISSHAKRLGSCGYPRAMHLHTEVHRARHRDCYCTAYGRKAEVIKAEILSMEEELEAVKEQARDCLEQRAGLLDVIAGMETLALKCLQQSNLERARGILEEKGEMQKKADGLTEKVENLVKLEVRLTDAVKGRRAELFQSELGEGRSYEDTDIGVRVVMGDDGKPRFERTGSVGASGTKPSPTAGANEPPAYAQQPPPAQPSYTSQDVYFTVDDLLNESDRRLDDKFLELERQQLERMLRASGDAPPDADPDAPPSAPPATAPDRPTVRPEAKVGAGVSEARMGTGKVVNAEWWTMGQNSLMDGILMTVKKEHKPIYESAAKALVAVTNARIRGTDPTCHQLLSLIVLSVLSPEEHATSTFWGVDQAPGAATMPETVKLAVFGAALQFVVEDLLTGDSQFLTREDALRAKEARALLVALASAVQLPSAVASDFSVKVICRAMRTCLLNAHVLVRQAYAQEDADALQRAEADLQALHNVLKTLPCALPVAMKHVAALEATHHLRKSVGPLDAKRLDKLYRQICNEDLTASTVTAILEPILRE